MDTQVMTRKIMLVVAVVVAVVVVVVLTQGQTR